MFMISGKTTLIAHLGYPTFAFKAPLIYNPWFEKNGIDAVVVPMGVQTPDYPDFFRALFTLTNIRGALVTMPHKVTTIELVDELTPTARVAGAANGVLRRDDGTLVGDQFDGAGFVRGVERKGFALQGKKALVVGNGGVGSPIAASLAAAGVGSMTLFDPNAAASEPAAWLATLERLVTEKGVASEEMLGRYREAWDRAADRTPHGTAIELTPGDFSRREP